MRRPTDPYSELGVTPGATPAEIQHAFRRRLREHHPDSRPPDADEAASDAALQRLLAAYRMLRSRDTGMRPPPVTIPVRPSADLRVSPVHWAPDRRRDQTCDQKGFA
jgi:molecular chaperone DnaJ